MPPKERQPSPSGRGWLHERPGEGRTAQTLICNARQEQPDVGMDSERLKRAVDLRDAGQVEDALRELAELKAITPDPANQALILVHESVVLAKAGRFEKAHAKADEATRLCSDRVTECNALVAHSGAHSVEGKRDYALAELDLALRNYPDVLGTVGYRFLYEEIQLRRGLLLIWLNRLKEARDTLQECQRFDLSREERCRVLSNLGACYHDLGELDHAVEALTEFLRMCDGCDNEFIAGGADIDS